MLALDRINNRDIDMNYDPNLTCSGKMATQYVRLTFQCWQYTKEILTTVGGNCTGLHVIETAVENTYDDLDEWMNTPFITLMDNEGNELECADDENQGHEFLKDMLTKAEITDIKPTE